MSNVIQAGSKYLIIIFFAVFVLISFRVQQDTPQTEKNGRYNAQAVLVLLIHALAFACIAVNIAEGAEEGVTVLNIGILYVLELAYFIFMLAVLPHIINLSRGLNNIMCMFLVIGMFMLARLSYTKGRRQFLMLLAATVVFLIFQFLYKIFKGMYKLTWAFLAASMALMLLVMIFAGVSKGARISIDLGFITFQPFEFVKILFVLFVAGAFNKANSFKTVCITAVFAAAHLLILVYCTDLGTALIILVVYVMMVYVATKKPAYVFLGMVGFAVACVAAYFMFSHVRTRVSAWLDPWSDIDNTGYQITQSLFAIGTGGWFGSGLYQGSPSSIPEVSNDFIFSAISEEMGAIFAMLLIILCMLFALTIFRISIRISHPFYKLTAFGLGAAYAFQVFLTIGGAIKMIPSTGINLPFISSGGSSLLASMLIVGIVQALYVISEADVQREREAIRDRIIVSADSFEDEFEEEYEDGYEEKYEDDDIRPVVIKRTKSKYNYDEGKDAQKIYISDEERISADVGSKVAAYKDSREEDSYGAPDVIIVERNRTKQKPKSKVQKIDPDDL